MNRAYAELSLRFGFFAAAADHHLGGTEFITRGRAQRWQLSETLLQTWMYEAIRRGVPADALVMNDAQSRAMDALVEKGMRLQTAIDQKNGYVHD